jgi:hypothetical protein
MSDDTSVLGKRLRDEVGASAHTDGVPPPAEVEEDSDDDVGPMPMPDNSSGGVTKKKRKGMLDLSHSSRRTSRRQNAILSYTP